MDLVVIVSMSLMGDGAAYTVEAVLDADQKVIVNGPLPSTNTPSSKLEAL